MSQVRTRQPLSRRASTVCTLLAALWLLAAAGAVAADFRVVTVSTGLNYPWSIAWLPDGTALVTERPGQLRRLHADGSLDPQPVAGVPAVLARSQGGLFEALPHPQFAANQLVYLSYAHGTASANATRIARARLTANGLVDLQVIFEVAPLKDTINHYGGRMAWLPDGTLLMTTGDGQQYREAAQDLGSLIGKVVRVNDDGSIPADNPFVDQPGARPEVYSYGHRNPQGLVVDPRSAAIWENEHGSRGGDEINHIIAGRNYGWPAVTYGIDYTGAYVSPYHSWPGMEEPALHWTPSIAPSGMALYTGTRFPAWQGNLFVSALAAKRLHRVQLQGDQVVAQELLLEDLGERLRDVRQGPDGYLYVLTDNADGRVLRLEPNDPLAGAAPR